MVSSQQARGKVLLSWLWLAASAPRHYRRVASWLLTGAALALGESESNLELGEIQEAIFEDWIFMFFLHKKSLFPSN